MRLYTYCTREFDVPELFVKSINFVLRICYISIQFSYNEIGLRARYPADKHLCIS